ncbi:MAG: hypothetical protein HC812_20240 [Leptolyngbya sp. RL_3_1]|nr:hypothetical protein [Leptolyngbya sp. RL_3_1]
MAHQGYIDANVDRLDELLRAVVSGLDSPQTRLALWLIEAFDFAPLPAWPIGRQSPLMGSTSELAGFGQQIDFSAIDTATLIMMLTAEEHLDCQIMHLEIEVQGSVQFAAYDYFESIAFGTAFSLDWLDALKADGVIWGYQLFDNSRPG